MISGAQGAHDIVQCHACRLSEHARVLSCTVVQRCIGALSAWVESRLKLLAAEFGVDRQNQLTVGTKIYHNMSSYKCEHANTVNLESFWGD